MSGINCSIAGATYAAAVVNSAVSFDGTGDYYTSATNFTGSGTDSTDLIIACSFFFASDGNSVNDNLVVCKLGTGTTAANRGWSIILQSGRIRFTRHHPGGADAEVVYLDYQGFTQNAYNHFLIYIKPNASNNRNDCKAWINGVDRSTSWRTGSEIGAFALNGSQLTNWANTSGSTVRFGSYLSGTGMDTFGDDFTGRISQFWATGGTLTAPAINSFYNTTTSLPKDLGTQGTATGLARPYIYHYGTTSTFPTNNGTGFNAYTLTATGNIADAVGPTYGAGVTYRTDSYSSFLKLALPFDAISETTDVAYLVSGSGLTASATKTQGANVTSTTAQRYWTSSPDYVKSADFAPGGDALTYVLPTAIPTSASGTFVIEGWFRAEATGTKWCISSADSGGRFIVSVSNAAVSNLTTSEGNQNFIYIGTSWTHVAFVCDGGTKRCYYNGIYRGAWLSGNTGGFSTLHLGQFNAGDANDYDGQIQDFRVYVGTNRGYTGTATGSANFTLPSSIIEG